MSKDKDVLDVFISKTNWKYGSFSILPIVFGVVMAIVDVVMMFTAKFVSLGSISYGLGLTIATLVYSVQPYLFIKATRLENMSVSNLIWNLTSNVLVTFSGVMVFKESIKGLRWVAIGMSMIAILLFAYTDD
jgi:multidrug transporter EmrE-like cation transporter|uniref:EamA domain-containing protein n=1 Tax=viral metagenome TaxID=1070528 RepID=A0A6C0KAD5_9ZZZZ